MRQVRCTTPGCEHVGVIREVPDLPVVRGVVQRPALYCAGCDATLSDGSPHASAEKAVKRAPETR